MGAVQLSVDAEPAAAANGAAQWPRTTPSGPAREALPAPEIRTTLLSTHGT